MSELINMHHAPTRTTDIDPWKDEALCIYEENPDIFFPDYGDVQTALDATQVCAKCPVAAQCLDYAINNNINDGIFGGLSAKARIQLRKKAV